MNRHTFLQTVTVGATSLVGLSSTSALSAEKINWPIGGFHLNRAWTQWSCDDTLDGIKAAGYKPAGLLTSQRGDAEVEVHTHLRRGTWMSARIWKQAAT